MSEGQSQGRAQGEGQRHKSKHGEVQIYAMLLLVTFGILILVTPAYVMLFYINFFLCGIPFILPSRGEDHVHQPWDQLLSLCHFRTEIQDRLACFV